MRDEMGFLRFWLFSFRVLFERLRELFAVWAEDVRYDLSPEDDDGDWDRRLGAFTPEELANVTEAMLEYHFETPHVRTKSLQNKPLTQGEPTNADFHHD